MHKGSTEYYDEMKFTLEPNEHLTKVITISDSFGVLGLQFITNKDRSAKFITEDDSLLEGATVTINDFGTRNRIIRGFKTIFQEHLKAFSVYTIDEELAKTPVLLDSDLLKNRVSKRKNLNVNTCLSSYPQTRLNTIVEIDSAASACTPY